MDSYKKLWKKLKSNITDKNVLDLMKQYENVSIRKSRVKTYSIVIQQQPWYDIYRKIQQILYQKTYRNVIDKKELSLFKKIFSEHMKLLSSGKMTNEEMGSWLEEAHNKYKAIHKDMTYKIKKPMTTTSGFKRKLRSQLTEKEVEAIVIDELVYRFTPKLQKEYKDLILDINYYEEEWRQELWLWCWKHKDTDPNLKALIINFNRLTTAQYKFHIKNILSRMNKYIIPYIEKLQHPINSIGNYYINYNYREEELYPANDLSAINKMDIDLSEKPNYIVENIEDIIIHKMLERNLVQSIMDDFDKRANENKHETNKWSRYKTIIQMRYGFNIKNHIYSLQEIGDYFNITRERVRQLENDALNHIKKNLLKPNQ